MLSHTIALRQITTLTTTTPALALCQTAQITTRNLLDHTGTNGVGLNVGGKMNILKTIMFFALLVFSTFAYAGDQFCAGFEEGYKTVKGDMTMVPMCPLAPLTPLGSTDYREGIKAGMRAAQR